MKHNNANELPKHIHDEKNGLEYTLHGNYYFPDLNIELGYPLGKEDYTQYQMASAMLSYINANSVGINDGINFVDDCVDIEQTKETFRMVFALMNQEQHYEMMMSSN